MIIIIKVLVYLDIVILIILDINHLALNNYYDMTYLNHFLLALLKKYIQI